MLSLHIAGIAFPLLEMLGGALNCLAISFLFAFSRDFLRTQYSEPKYDRVLGWIQRAWLYMPLTLVFILHPPWLFIYMTGLTWVCLASVAFLLWIVTRRWREGNPLALLFLASFSPYLLGALIILFSSMDPVAWDDEKRLFVLIGNALSLILLSLIPIYRSRKVRKAFQSLTYEYDEKLELEVQAKTESLQILSKQLHTALENRGRILAVIGHDLRSPLISLQSLVDLLQRRADLSREELIQWSSHIDQVCKLQLELLNNLLTLGTHNDLPSSDQPVVNIKHSVQTAWGQVQHLAADKNISLNEDIPPDADVIIKAELFYTVLRNVFVNAIKYSNPADVIHASCTVEDDKTTLFIQDQGIGLTAQQLSDILTGKVKSTPGTQGEVGSGVGLNICRDLLHSSAGELSLESPSSNGTRVAITLPTSTRTASTLR